MACVTSKEGYVSVSCGINTYIKQLCDDSEIICIDHTKLHELNKCGSVLIENPAVKSNKILDEDIGLSLLCSDFSPCGTKFAFCTLAKNLCIVDISNPRPFLLSIHQLSRGASKVQFTPQSNKVIVADKSGDLQLFDLERSSGEIILGHLSMLLDVLVTPNEEFIITCDRDEKIRVSSFPDAYNIVAYCLGHTEFVSSINLLPHDNNSLISASGDGTVRLWDFKVGTELTVCNTFSHLKSSDGKEDLSAITDSVAMYLNSTTSLIFVCVAQLNVCLVLKSVTHINRQIDCSVIQDISFQDSSPWKLSISCNIVWLLLNSNDKVIVKAMLFNHNSCQFTDNVPEKIIKSLNSINGKCMTIDYKNVLRLLFKKKFYNVQEYLKKKDARLVLEEPSNKKTKTY